MAFKSILKPDGSITIGIATAVFVYTIYGQSLPPAAVIHATDAGDLNIEQGRKKAAYASAAALAGITLLTKDVSVFILGAATLFAVDMHARHANSTAKDTGMLVTQGYGYGNQLRSVS